MPKPTFSDIAQRAGVGTATVERVLNGRGGVRPATTEKVLAAARALDYPRRLPEIHHGLLRIEVVLVRPETTFYRRLSRAFERVAATLDPSVAVHRTFLDERDPEAIASRIASPAMRRAGLILAVPDHPRIRAAVTATVASGLPVVHVVTRAADGAGDLVSIDNYAAGRTAAHFVVFEALEGWPDLIGLYNAGAGNAALADVLRRHRRGRQVFFVGHELTEHTAAALREGVMAVVLDQAPEAQARRAIDLMLQKFGLLRSELDMAPIRFVTHTAENI